MAAVFSGMEDQVKRQRNINTTNSPQAWANPSLRGRTKEDLTHFFGYYRKFSRSEQEQTQQSEQWQRALFEQDAEL